MIKTDGEEKVVRWEASKLLGTQEEIDICNRYMVAKTRNLVNEHVASENEVMVIATKEYQGMFERRPKIHEEKTKTEEGSKRWITAVSDMVGSQNEEESGWRMQKTYLIVSFWRMENQVKCEKGTGSVVHYDSTGVRPDWKGMTFSTNATKKEGWPLAKHASRRAARIRSDENKRRRKRKRRLNVASNCAAIFRSIVGSAKIWAPSLKSSRKTY